ncbi:MAG: glycine cleavage system protein H [Planctomycetes bacterium]|nr:glycine cleavage system protein H [Planctomycetota bacterium]
MADMTFMMGKFAAVLPGDLRYCRNHMWCRPLPDGVLRFGFSSYAIRLMQDVYFLDWSVNEGDGIAMKQSIGNIETSKAVSDLFAPLPGTMVAINAELLKDPSGINVDNHGKGWLFDMKGSADSTMDVQGYFDFLTAGWDNTQRILKGQMGD